MCPQSVLNRYAHGIIGYPCVDLDNVFGFVLWCEEMTELNDVSKTHHPKLTPNLIRRNYPKN